MAGPSQVGNVGLDTASTVANMVVNNRYTASVDTANKMQSVFNLTTSDTKRVLDTTRVSIERNTGGWMAYAVNVERATSVLRQLGKTIMESRVYAVDEERSLDKRISLYKQLSKETGVSIGRYIEFGRVLSGLNVVLPKEFERVPEEMINRLKESGLTEDLAQQYATEYVRILKREGTGLSSRFDKGVDVTEYLSERGYDLTEQKFIKDMQSRVRPDRRYEPSTLEKHTLTVESKEEKGRGFKEWLAEHGPAAQISEKIIKTSPIKDTIFNVGRGILTTEVSSIFLKQFMRGLMKDTGGAHIGTVDGGIIGGVTGKQGVKDILGSGVITSTIRSIFGKGRGGTDTTGGVGNVLMGASDVVKVWIVGSSIGGLGGTVGGLTENIQDKVKEGARKLEEKLPVGWKRTTSGLIIPNSVDNIDTKPDDLSRDIDDWWRLDKEGKLVQKTWEGSPIGRVGGVSKIRGLVGRYPRSVIGRAGVGLVTGAAAFGVGKLKEQAEKGEHDTTKVGLGYLQNALTGASTGAILGPWGMGIGAGLGLITEGFKHYQNVQLKKETEKEYNIKELGEYSKSIGDFRKQDWKQGRGQWTVRAAQELGIELASAEQYKKYSPQKTAKIEEQTYKKLSDEKKLEIDKKAIELQNKLATATEKTKDKSAEFAGALKDLQLIQGRVTRVTQGTVAEYRRIEQFEGVTEESIALRQKEIEKKEKEYRYAQERYKEMLEAPVGEYQEGDKQEAKRIMEELRKEVIDNTIDMSTAQAKQFIEVSQIQRGSLESVRSTMESLKMAPSQLHTITMEVVDKLRGEAENVKSVYKSMSKKYVEGAPDLERAKAAWISAQNAVIQQMTYARRSFAEQLTAQEFGMGGTRTSLLSSGIGALSVRGTAAHEGSVQGIRYGRDIGKTWEDMVYSTFGTPTEQIRSFAEQFASYGMGTSVGGPPKVTHRTGRETVSPDGTIKEISYIRPLGGIKSEETSQHTLGTKTTDDKNINLKMDKVTIQIVDTSGSLITSIDGTVSKTIVSRLMERR